MSVKRVWHGWTTPENADKYQALLNQEIFPGIEKKKIPGYVSIELLRRELDGEGEFGTIMTFESIENVIDFNGKDFERCYVPDAAKEVLERWNEFSSHYEAIESRVYG